MKKIVMIFAAMAAVLSSCQKSELESVSVNDGKDIVLNISVSNPGASDTKALIKQGWVENDQIKIWFDANTGDTPDLVIKYDGSSKWTQDGTANNVPASGSGYVKAVYDNKVIVASKDNYSVSGNTLTFDIENWTFLTEIQVVVYGDDIDGTKPSDYTLSCDKFTPCTGYNVGESGITATTGTKGASVIGISNDGVDSKPGVAFVFATADYSSSSTEKKDFAFTLKDNTSGSEVTKVYTPNVAIEAKSGKSSIKALTIASSKFAVPTKGTAKATIDYEQVDVNWVQLWAGGPKFAEYNVGASSVTDGGHAMEFTEARKTGSNYVWGANWCTPSYGQMNELLLAAQGNSASNVTCKYCEYTTGDDIWGFKFTGKETGYTSNSVFFPAEDGDSSHGSANYWSATADGSNAWKMNLHYEDSVYDWFSGWDSREQDFPYFVRPVLLN